MAFTVREYRDLLRLLNEHPDWREELRQTLLSDDFLALPRVVHELAEAQRRTEQRVEELAEAQRRTDQRLESLAAKVEDLAEAQRRTEQRVEELAEAQRRTEQRVEELAEAQRRTEQRVEELAVAQRRTEQRVEELAEAQQRTRTELGRLAEHVGASLEEEAADVLEVVLQRKGYRILSKPIYLRRDYDMDVLLPVEDAQGQRYVAVVEAKVRLGRSKVEAWARRMDSPGFRARLAKAGYPGPYLVYLYGMRVDVSVEDAVRSAGVGLLNSRGEEITPRKVRE